MKCKTICGRVSRIKGILDGTVSMSDARKEIREALDAAGYAPPEGAEGGLRDHRSKSRLDLILTQNGRASCRERV